MNTTWKAKFAIRVPKTPDVEKETRQQLRALLRRQAYVDLTARYPGESHETRREMALARARRDYRTLKNLPEPRP